MIYFSLEIHQPERGPALMSLRPPASGDPVKPRRRQIQTRELRRQEIFITDEVEKKTNGRRETTRASPAIAHATM